MPLSCFHKKSVQQRFFYETRLLFGRLQRGEKSPTTTADEPAAEKEKPVVAQKVEAGRSFRKVITDTLAGSFHAVTGSAWALAQTPFRDFYRTLIKTPIETVKIPWKGAMSFLGGARKMITDAVGGTFGMAWNALKFNYQGVKDKAKSLNILKNFKETVWEPARVMAAQTRTAIGTLISGKTQYVTQGLGGAWHSVQSGWNRAAGNYATA